jgi:hypothetical protein
LFDNVSENGDKPTKTHLSTNANKKMRTKTAVAIDRKCLYSDIFKDIYQQLQFLHGRF